MITCRPDPRDQASDGEAIQECLITGETRFAIAHSPVPDDTAPRGNRGVIATVVEIMDKLAAARRIRTLRDIGASPGEVKIAEFRGQL